MSETAPSSLASRALRVLLLGFLGLVAIFIEIAPIGFTPHARPSPDILFAIVAYWSVRRPGSTPVMLIFGLGLVRDLLADVPVGAGTLALILVVEFLRTQGATLVRQSFFIEWATVSMVAFVMISIQFLLVALTLAQPPFASALLYQGLYTAAVYPAVALVLRWVLRIGWRTMGRRGDDRRGPPGLRIGGRA